MKYISISSIIIFILCLGQGLATQKRTSRVTLKDGEVWIQLSNSGGTIQRISISPSGHYLAAEKAVGWFKGHNDNPQPDEKPEMVPKLHILIFNLETLTLQKELVPKYDLLGSGLWRENDIYWFYEGTELDVGAEYEYHLKKDKIIVIYDYYKGYKGK